MDLSQSVIMPREDFIELQVAAWDKVPTTLGERIAQTTQTTFVMAGLAAAVVGATWGCVQAIDWMERRRLNRINAESRSTSDTK